MQILSLSRAKPERMQMLSERNEFENDKLLNPLDIYIVYLSLYATFARDVQALSRLQTAASSFRFAKF